MSGLSIKEIDRLRYRPTKAAEEFLGELRSALGLADKATAARLALARSLSESASGKSMEDISKSDGTERGMAIEGVHLFGDDSDLWACLLADAASEEIASTSDFKTLLEWHWHRGAELLQSDYKESKSDDIDFIVKLASLVPGGRASGSKDVSRPTTAPVASPVYVQIISDSHPWKLNAPGGNGLMVISGKPGSGKSQLALDLLTQVSKQGVRFLFFDLKGELEENVDSDQQQQKRRTFIEDTSAEYLRLIESHLPINPLFTGSNSAETAQIASEIAHLVKCFASQLGANQERAIREVYEELSAPDFDSITEGLRERGQEGVALSVLEKISSFQIFSSSNEAESLAEWLSRSRIIDFKSLGNDNDTKALIVAFILNAIMRQLNQNLPITNEVQPLQMVLFVDEAHHLLPKEGKAGLLGSLARQGRSWGFPVWLASQDADAFITKGQHATDFAELADCGVHLTPGVLSETQQRQILGKVLSKKLASGEGVLNLRNETSIGMIRQYWRDQGLPVPPPQST